MESESAPKRVLVALRGTSQVESRAALHWALNSLPIRPGIDSVMLFHVVKVNKVVPDGRLGLPYLSASPPLQMRIRQLAMSEAAAEMQHYVQVCARKFVVADYRLSWGDRQPAILQAVEDSMATHLVMGARKKRSQLNMFWKGSLSARVAKAARCSLYLVNRRAQLESTHLYTGERGPVGTHADGTLVNSASSGRLRRDDGTDWQDLEDELTPEAVAERLAAAEKVQAEVDAWRRDWAANLSATAGGPASSLENGSTGDAAGSSEHGGSGAAMGGTAGSGKIDDLTAGSGKNDGLTAGSGNGNGLAIQKLVQAAHLRGTAGAAKRGWELDGESDGEDEEGVPSLFLCCISQDMMMDPVIAADGQTYERAQIVQWLRRKQTSPLTNLPLSDRGLIPNDSLRAAIKEWKEYRREGVLNKVDIGG